MKNRYMKSVKFGGDPYSKNFLKYSELIQGATIDVEMDDVPNKRRGINDSDFPYSYSNENK